MPLDVAIVIMNRILEYFHRQHLQLWSFIDAQQQFRELFEREAAVLGQQAQEAMQCFDTLMLECEARVWQIVPIQLQLQLELKELKQYALATGNPLPAKKVPSEKNFTYVCKICGLILKDVSQLMSHMMICRLGSLPTLQTAMAKSDQCNVVAKNVVQSGQRNSVCRICGANFSHPSSLTRHMKTVHHRKACNDCNALFDDDIQLIAHKTGNCKKNTIVAEPTVSKPIATVASRAPAITKKKPAPARKSKKRLRKTNNARSKKKTFPCTTCGQVFDSEVDSEEHMKRHATEVTAVQPFEAHIVSELEFPEILCDSTKTGDKDVDATIVQQIPDASETDDRDALDPSIDPLQDVDERQPEFVDLTGEPEKNGQTEQTSTPATTAIEYECDYCGKKFPTKMQIYRHVETHNTARRTFVCKVCDAGFRLSSLLRIHMRSHEGQKTHACPICAKQFSTQTTMMTHMVIHAVNNPHVCKQCNKSFSSSFCLKSHSVTHTNEKPYVCAKCNYPFTLRSNLLRHMKQHIGNTNCTKCPEKFLTLHELKHHMRQTHKTPRQQVFKCKICGEKFEEKKSFRLHMRTHNDELRFECHLCKRKFLWESELSIHMKRCIGEKEFRCGQCPKLFTFKHEAESHFRRKHIKSFQCDQCDEVFNSLKRLERHTEWHTKQRPFKCPKCGRRFADEDALHSHEEGHRLRENTVCRICDREFVDFGTLRAHLKRHTDKKSFECAHCLQACFTKGELKIHLHLMHRNYWMERE